MRYDMYLVYFDELATKAWERSEGRMNGGKSILNPGQMKVIA